MNHAWEKIGKVNYECTKCGLVDSVPLKMGGCRGVRPEPITPRASVEEFSNVRNLFKSVNKKLLEADDEVYKSANAGIAIVGYRDGDNLVCCLERQGLTKHECIAVLFKLMTQLSG